MARLAYLGVLAGCLIGALWLEVAARTRVLRRWRRLTLTVLPVLVVFGGWDLYAIAHRQWVFSRQLTSGFVLPGHLPIEEALFFLVVPVCAVLAYEAVRAVTGWPGGDEP